MSAWSSKRKTIIFILLGLVTLAWFLIFIAPQFKVTPTCFDGIQNGSEEGVDCGGDCPQYCPAQALDVTTVWSRVFRVVPGRYNAVALLENQNTDAALASAAYEFRLYDNSNVFVARRTGRTYLIPNNKMLVLEAGIETGDRVPVRSEFVFTETPFWLQVPKELRSGIPIATSSIMLRDPFTSPSLSARVQNNSRFTIYNMDVSAVLYNANNNVIAASQTFIEELPEGRAQDVFFTWQDSFAEEPVRIEILPQVDVFRVMQYR